MEEQQIPSQNSEVPTEQPAAEESKQVDHRKSRLVRMMVAFVVITIFAVLGLVFQDKIGSLLASQEEQDSTLTIAYAEGFTSIDPTNYEVRNRQYFGNIFEGLTRFDKNLDVEPGLAISWGQVSDDTWEFKLREGVYFHDSTSFEASDVVTSIDYALDNDDSQLKSLLDPIVSVEAVSDYTVQIVTDGVDPLLPNRLAYVYIFASEALMSYENLLVGTGPYYAVSYGVLDDSDYDQEFTMKAFPYYWGFAPEYDDVFLYAISDKNVRQESIKNGDVDVIVNVAAESTADLEAAGIEIISQPGLETSFMVFDTIGGVFDERNLREAFVMAIDRDAFVEELGGYAARADQFVSNGVSGYDSSIEGISYDPDAAEDVFEEYGVSDFEIYMVYEMSALGQFLEEEFLKVGVDVDIVYVTSVELQDLIGEVDVYFMGWKSDLGDAADLYETVFYSEGAYNGGYASGEADALIDEASELEGSERLSVLKEIMGILVEDDVVGMPLFDSQTIYAFGDGITWSPRVDGYVWAFEVR